MPDRLNIVYNAADAINHFSQVGLEYPLLGGLIEPSEILQVIESRYQRLYALLGFTASGAEVVLQVKSLEGEIMTIEDRLGNLNREWVCRIATDPAPRVSVPHADLLFNLERV